jgi:hypothetical protein
LGVLTKANNKLRMKLSSIRTVRPIDVAAVKNAPWVNVKAAASLTGLGEKVIRKLTVKKFGKRDFASVEEVNRFILGKEETKIEVAA